MYQRLATHRFVLRPGSGEDMRRLLETLQAEAWHGEQIVYLWGGRHLEQEIPSAQSLQSLIITNCFGVVSLVQHMTQMGGTSLPKLWIVTCGAQVPDAKEYPTVEQAPLYGMGRVIHNEHPELYSTLVDIGAPQKLPGGYTYDESVLEALYRELQTKAEESEVLLRGHARYVNRISRVELDSRSPETSTPLLRSDACYLIIGGVSGFGFETAKWMVRRGARHLILASLSGLATKQIRDEVEALRADGSNISVVSLDVTQEQDVERLFEQLRSGPLPLRGVIHAAALFHDRPIRELDEATIATVMAPKVMGAWNLHKQTQTMPLDFFLLYSSVTVLVGNNSQGSYVAGNAFMDALAHWRRTQGLPATAVEWGALAQVGVVAQNKELSDILTRKGLSATAPQQYLNLLETTLSTQQPLLAIANVDWRRLDAFLLTRSSRLRCLDLLSEEMQEASGNPQDLTRVLLATAPEDRQALVQEYLTQALAKLLGKPTTSLTSHSADLGLDSLMAMELRHTLRKDLKIDIPVMQILHVRNLSSMAILLTERLVERV
jgi:acyl carrier protein